MQLKQFRKAIAIYKTNKLVLSKKQMSLKARGSETVTDSKKYLQQKVVLSVANKLNGKLPMKRLWAILEYTRKNSHI